MQNKVFKTIYLLPVIIYSIVLILLPLLYVLYLSFLTSDSYGGMINTFTLQNYINIFDITYIKMFLKSSLIAVITTVFPGCSPHKTT